MEYKRKKESKEDIIDILTLEAFKSEGYLIVNKTLIKVLGLFPAILLSNYIDKCLYFRSKYPDNDGWFYLTHEQQAQQLNIGERFIRKNKQFLIEKGILLTERRGIPSKEWLKINSIVLSNLLLSSNEEKEQKEQVDSDIDPDVDLHIDLLKTVGLDPAKVQGLDPAKVQGLDSAKVQGLDSAKVQGLYNNTIYNNTKNNNTKNNNIIPSKNFSTDSSNLSLNSSSLKKERRSSLKEKKEERNHIYYPLAEKLAQTIESSKNIKITATQLKQWTNDIRQMEESSGISYKRIDFALTWYRKHIGQAYVPVIESGRALRDKFLKLEAAMERERTNDNHHLNHSAVTIGYIDPNAKFDRIDAEM